MSIISFRFENKDNTWRFQETHFSPFNLLVGHSGVGKTRILQALDIVSRAGTQNLLNSAAGCSWLLKLSIDEHIYQWETRIENTNKNPIFEEETITLNGNELVTRKQIDETFIFNNKPLPKLNKTDSAITLLKDEETILPLYSNLRSFIFSINNEMQNNELHEDLNDISFEDLQKQSDTPLIVKAYIIQQQHKETFHRIQNKFIEIFATVNEIKIETKSGATQEKISIFLTIHETGVNTPIHAYRISSGMLRTLCFLFELALAPKGSVFLVDEIENGLGVNCLPHIIDAMQERNDEVQFILTSHHPYVINNIPYKDWKLVMRSGGEVWVKNATDVRALQSQSAHDQFIQLINSPEYEEGIS
ncbi:MAG: ATP-binding protein [Magnetococcales bacterium]|nr:ATP-binding protein [Magnetococcales bacterium]